MREIRSPIPAVFWGGMDLAKRSFQAALWGHQELGKMSTQSFDRTRKAVKIALDWFKSMAPKGVPIGIVMEATGTFAEDVAAWLLEMDPGLRVAIVNPGQTSAFVKSLGLRNKTDDLDSRALARYGFERSPIVWERPTPEMAALKDLVRIRTDLVRARASMSCRLKDHERCPEACHALEATVRNLEGEVEALDRAIEDHIAAHQELAPSVKRLMSIKGVGIVTATTVLVELGDLRRFTRSRQLTAFAGLSPKQRLSGTSVKGKAHLCKQGSPRVRAVLYMAAGSAIRFNPDLKAFYEGLLAKGKTERSAQGAVMRKLLVLMRAVLKRGNDWEPMRKTA